MSLARAFLKSNSMILKTTFLACLLGGLIGSARAQYFYQDLYQTKATMAEHHQYVQQGVRHVSITSFDADQSPNQDFRCTKEIKDNFKQVMTHTASPSTGSSTILTFFDDDGRITHTVDSTSQSVNTTYYYYNAQKTHQVDSLLFRSYSARDKDTFRYGEVHLYEYDPQGNLRTMVRKKNEVLYSTVHFETDSLGRVIKEEAMGKHDTVPPYYYKYNGAGQLTDIFHYNPARRKMEPDYLFDYDVENKLSEKTIVSMNTNNYLLWKFAYDKDGLIASEQCYGKKHALLGVLRFKYTR